MLNYLVPTITIIIIVYGLYKKKDIFNIFLEGVEEGLIVVKNLFPTIFAMLITITLITNSNIIGDLINLLKINFPSEVLSLAILRPISGSSSLVVLNNILNTYGPDSFIGRLASVMQGSTDTTIYILTLYFASIKIKKIKYSLIVGLLSDFFSILISLVVVSIIFK